MSLEGVRGGAEAMVVLEESEGEVAAAWEMANYITRWGALVSVCCCSKHPADADASPGVQYVW